MGVLLALAIPAQASAYQESYGPQGLQGLQMQNVVSSSFLHDRGEILYRPNIRLMLDKGQQVSFSFVNAKGERVAAFQETLSVGSSFVIVDRGSFEDLPPGNYLLRAEASGETEEVRWIKTDRARAREGSVGKDKMTGKAKDDYFAGGSGGDTLKGKGGNDSLWGDTATDFLYGGPGADMIDGASAGDKLYGDDGDDTIYAGYGHDSLWGGKGNDSLDGSFAPDSIWGGEGDDVLHGGGGSDMLDGGPGNDKLFPDSSGDTIIAGEGDDQIFYNSGTGSRSVDCGPGNDTLYLNGPGGEGYYSSRKMLREGRTKDCEQVIWAETQADDPRIGAVLQPEAPGEHLQGTGINDRLLGNASSESFTGEAGDDEIWANCCFIGAGKTSVDSIDAGEGDDTVYGGFGKTTTQGGPGSDYLQGGQGPYNQIDAGEGNDFVRLSGGNTGRAIVQGGEGDDDIWAVTSHSGKVTVSCGPGKDVVYALKEARVAKDCERIKRY